MVVFHFKTKPFSLMAQQGKQLTIFITVLSLVICVTFYSNLAVWSEMKADSVTEEDALTVGGVRKLLEEEELVTEKLHLPGTEKRLPQSIIIGVRKCGTRALLEFLDLHPSIQPADHEVHFFDDNQNYHLGYDWYKKHMPYSYPSQITLEKSPRYFITDQVPERIHQMNSSVKLIVLLRNPTTRVISDYTQVFYNRLAKGKTVDKFEDLVINKNTNEINTGFRAVWISIYHLHFTRWLSLFKRDQIHVVDGDKLIDNPLSEIQKVEKFLGLKSLITDRNLYYNSTRGFYCMRTNKKEKCLGATKGRKHPEIHKNILNKLDNFFRPHNEKLYSMINQKFDWG